MNIAFIGGGNMAEAIMSAVLVKGIAKAEEITVSDISETRRDYIHNRYQVKTTANNAEAVQGREIVILAVKPQVLNDVMPGLKGRLTAEQLVISIIAGKSLQDLPGRIESPLHRTFDAQYSGPGPEKA